MLDTLDVPKEKSTGLSSPWLASDLITAEQMVREGAENKQTRCLRGGSCLSCLNQTANAINIPFTLKTTIQVGYSSHVLWLDNTSEKEGICYFINDDIRWENCTNSENTAMFLFPFSEKQGWSCSKNVVSTLLFLFPCSYLHLPFPDRAPPVSSVKPFFHQ